MVHGARTSTVSNGQTDGRTDGRRGAEPPTGADFTFCAQAIIRVTNGFFKYLSPLASLGADNILALGIGNEVEKGKMNSWNACL